MNASTPTFDSLPQVHVLNPQPSSRRNGKIARLPKETRDMINRMLDDGLPYHVIIDELGEAGEGLNTQNLTNWKQGGYREWVKNQELIEQTRAQTEHAIDLLRETDGTANTAKVIEACHMVGAAQLMHALMYYGDDAVKKMLLDKPERYISLLNVICRLANSGLRYDKHHLLISLMTAKGSPSPRPERCSCEMAKCEINSAPRSNCADLVSAGALTKQYLQPEPVDTPPSPGAADEVSVKNESNLGRGEGECSPHQAQSR